MAYLKGVFFGIGCVFEGDEVFFYGGYSNLFIGDLGEYLCVYVEDMLMLLSCA